MKEYDMQAVFSRHGDLLSAEYMPQTCAIIVGVGSVGSLVAAQLARSGVGRIVMIDPDTLQEHNISRHQLTLREVGRHKVTAMTGLLWSINPDLHIIPLAESLMELSPRTLDHVFGGSAPAIVVAATDSLAVNEYAGRLATMYALPFVAIGLWERASAGHVFWALPERKDPCFSCAFAEQLAMTVERPGLSYSTNDATEFMPGLYVDIALVTEIGIKVILDILLRYAPNTETRILQHYDNAILFSNVTNPRYGGDYGFSYPLQVVNRRMGPARPDCACQGGGGEAV